MLFCSFPFCLFFLAKFSPPTGSCRGGQRRVYLLLAASFTFYAVPRSKWLALGELLCLDGAGLPPGQRHGRLVFAPTAQKCCCLPAFSATSACFVTSNTSTFSSRSAEESAALLGLQVLLPTLKVVMPVGISFYTFEAINYTVDVYRRKIRAERDLSHFMLFILFFPHLMAGPIVRARDFLPQIRRRKHWSWLRANAGVLLIVMGVVKKLAIADRMALYVDPVFADPGASQQLCSCVERRHRLLHAALL